MTTLRVKEPFAADIKGISYVMTEGLVVGSDHPAVKGREHLFEPADDYAARRSASTVEQTTASPGERRHVVPRPAPAGEAAQMPASGTIAPSSGPAETAANATKPAKK